MTREEAAKIMKDYEVNGCGYCHQGGDEVEEAFDMAIKALEQEHCENWYDVPSDIMTLGQARQAVKDLRKKLAEYLRQQPCGDCISRQAAIDCITYEEEYMFECLKALPPVTPQQKIGKWIEVTNGRGGHECNLCHDYAPSYQSGDEYLSKYCPSCGAKMQEV